MTNDEKILNILEKQGKALETLQADVKDVKQSQAQTNERLSKLEKGQVRLEEGQTHLKTDVGRLQTAVEAIKAGVDDVRDKMATEATVMDQNAKLDRITRNHERRIEELETHAGLKNPYKN